MKPLVLEQLDFNLGRIAERDRLGDGRGHIAALFDFHARLLQDTGAIGKIVVGIDLEGHALERAACVAFERNRLLPKLGGKQGMILASVDKLQADDIGPIINLLLEVGRCQSRMAQSSYAYHRRCSHCCARVAASHPYINRVIAFAASVVWRGASGQANAAPPYLCGWPASLFQPCACRRVPQPSRNTFSMRRSGTSQISATKA